MGEAVNRWSAGIKAYIVIIYGFENLFFATKGIIKFQVLRRMEYISFLLLSGAAQVNIKCPCSSVFGTRLYVLQNNIRQVDTVQPLRQLFS